MPSMLYTVWSVMSKLCLAGMIFLLLILPVAVCSASLIHSVDHRAGVDEKGQLWLCLITETIVVFYQHIL